jgi:hypothetical protein
MAMGRWQPLASPMNERLLVDRAHSRAALPVSPISRQTGGTDAPGLGIRVTQFASHVIADWLRTPPDMTYKRTRTGFFRQDLAQDRAFWRDLLARRTSSRGLPAHSAGGYRNRRRERHAPAKAGLGERSGRATKRINR